MPSVKTMKITKEWLDQFFSAVDENNILRRRESVSIEFKEIFDWGTKEYKSKIAKSAAAFSNNRGGVIVFGVANKPHKIKGTSNFEETDDAEISTFFTNHFTPEIQFERKENEISGFKIGLLIIFESKFKPVVCTKDSARTFESDIYYRYGARTAKIRAGDLLYLLNEIREYENQKWLELLGNVAKIGISNIGLLNAESGELVAHDNTFILDEKLLDQIKILDQYSEEREGKPAVKIIGEIRELGKIIEKPKPIYDEDVYEAFLTERLITSGLEYIRAICRFNTQYYPFYFFLISDAIRILNAYEIVKRFKTRSAIKAKILERIQNDSHLLGKSRCYPFSLTELGKLRKLFHEKTIKSDQIKINSVKDCKIFFESIFSLKRGEYDIKFVKSNLYEIYKKYYPFEKDANNFTFRWALTYLDSIEYRDV